ncbi:hypothetical protein [Rhodoplanes azumiensis]|uniref:Uncharacterized protein n=1 Tax=Rhodoplanes azumiensis TaxID=1897628 RepID=A0ABW5ALH5_9BRAD
MLVLDGVLQATFGHSTFEDLDRKIQVVRESAHLLGHFRADRHEEDARPQGSPLAGRPALRWCDGVAPLDDCGRHRRPRLLLGGRRGVVAFRVVKFYQISIAPDRRAVIVGYADRDRITRDTTASRARDNRRWQPPRSRRTRWLAIDSRGEGSLP